MLFFLEFSSSGWVGTEFGTKIYFLSFSANLIPFRLKIMPQRGFLIFWIFLLFFFRIFLPWSSMNGIREFNFFFSFSAYLIPFWLKIMPERVFLIFLPFFLEFSSSGWIGTEFGTKIYFLSFPAYLFPFWLKIMPERVFLIFFNFFAIFFQNFLARVEYERDSGLKFFFLFLGLSNPVLAKNNAGKRFLNFLIYFLLLFLEFFCPGWVRTEFRTKFFFSLSRPISSCFS